MTKFRLPRKLKKTFSRITWVYPQDKNGCRRVAYPKQSQEAYIDFKKGIITPLIDLKKIKEKSKKLFEILDAEIEIDDLTLKTYIDDIFAEEYRYGAYINLVAAKKHPKAIVAYYNFINAYHLVQAGENHGNTCCLS